MITLRPSVASVLLRPQGQPPIQLGYAGNPVELVLNPARGPIGPPGPPGGGLTSENEGDGIRISGENININIDSLPKG